jgi:hypothetical protein
MLLPMGKAEWQLPEVLNVQQSESVGEAGGVW